MAGQPLWARLFYLVRTGHAEVALKEAIDHQQLIEYRELSFVSHFKTWVESPERKYVPAYLFLLVIKRLFVSKTSESQQRSFAVSV